MDSLVIAQPNDWRRIGDAGLSVVVDPMVFRTADVFLRGRRGAPRPDEAWTAIGKNIGSLCTFFDTLILEKCLPMYDYGSTFPPDLETGKHTLVEWCNERGPTLQQVQVCDAAYDEVKREALAALAGQPEVARDLASDILQETSAFDWEWRPDLWQGDWREQIERADVLAAFRFGGLLFGGYAQRTGCDHLLQPKRARLFLADRLRADRADDEALLFGRLTQLAGRGSRTADWPASPTFLPYLLAQDHANPRALLQHALLLRGAPEVADYRNWRRAAMRELADKGRIAAALERELAQIEAAVQRSLDPAAYNTGKFSVKIGAKLAAMGPELSAEAGYEKEFDLTLGWLPNLPGKRHHKLLQQMIASEDSYRRIERHLKILWDAAPAAG